MTTAQSETGPVWLLATRQRPDEAQECLDACELAGMRSQGIVIVDGDEDYSYRELRLPANWAMMISRDRQGLSAALRFVVGMRPAAQAYGWLADDNRPLTPGFDRLLEEAAGDWCLAYANDGGWLSGPYAAECEQGLIFTAGLCWGGELVREVGWLAFPESFQAGTDMAWSEIVRHLGLHRYLAEVIVEHRHWRSGKREQDSLDTDEGDTNGQQHTTGDCERIWQWVGSPDHHAIVRRIELAVDPRVAHLTRPGPTPIEIRSGRARPPRRVPPPPPAPPRPITPAEAAEHERLRSPQHRCT